MIYLDHAAVTPLDPAVFKKMSPYLQENFANPSSIYTLGRQARAAVDEGREAIAKIVQAKANEIYFTSGGTEANNWAIFGLTNATKKKHLITTRIEHHSVLHPFQELERRGYEITYLPLDPHGLISMKDLEKALTPETLLVSIMYANNEIGTIENIAYIGKLLRSKGIVFHTDACQAAGAISLNVEELQVDLMTLNAGKIYGPKGTGALYISENIKLTPLIYGGGQEHRLRAGTENVAGIVGFAEALRIAEEKRIHESVRLQKLRDDLLEGLRQKIPNLKLNGHPYQRLPNNINISIPGFDAESLLLRLDMEGICASSASACTSGSLEPSHVLLGLGLSKEMAKNSIRLTLGRKNTEKEIKTVLEVFSKILGGQKVSAKK